MSDKGHDHPHHWRYCSGAQTVDGLEQYILDDLRAGGFPPCFYDLLELWLAGLNEQENWEAFILNGAGNRVKELEPGNVVFNQASRYVYAQIKAPIVPPSMGIKLQLLEKRFYALKNEKDSGAEALKDTAQEVIDLCEVHDIPLIGGKLQYHEIPSAKS